MNVSSTRAAPSSQSLLLVPQEPLWYGTQLAPPESSTAKRMGSYAVPRGQGRKR